MKQIFFKLLFVKIMTPTRQIKYKAIYFAPSIKSIAANSLLQPFWNVLLDGLNLPHNFTKIDHR